MEFETNSFFKYLSTRSIITNHDSIMTIRGNEDTAEAEVDIFPTRAWRRKVEDRVSATFWETSLLTLSWCCRTCRCAADRRFVWTGGQARSRGSERMLRTLKVTDSKRHQAEKVTLWFIDSLGGHLDPTVRSQEHLREIGAYALLSSLYGSSVTSALFLLMCQTYS